MAPIFLGVVCLGRIAEGARRVEGIEVIHGKRNWLTSIDK